MNSDGHKLFTDMKRRLLSSALICVHLWFYRKMVKRFVGEKIVVLGKRMDCLLI